MVMCRCMGNAKWLAPITANTLATVHQEITNQVAGCISFSLITNATGDNARVVAMLKLHANVCITVLTLVNRDNEILMNTVIILMTFIFASYLRWKPMPRREDGIKNI